MRIKNLTEISYFLIVDRKIYKAKGIAFIQTPLNTFAYSFRHSHLLSSTTTNL